MVQVPKTVNEALKTDQQTVTNFWVKSIEKGMADFCVDFEVLKQVAPARMR